jgi:hypothetical protein
MTIHTKILIYRSIRPYIKTSEHIFRSFLSSNTIFNVNFFLINAFRSFNRRAKIEFPGEKKILLQCTWEHVFGLCSKLVLVAQLLVHVLVLVSKLIKLASRYGSYASYGN